jgi:phosphoserine phosphatase
MESKKLLIIDFCGTLVDDGKSIEIFLLYMIKGNFLLIILYYLFNFLNLFIYFFNLLFNINLKIFHKFILLKGFKKELILKKAKIYARYLSFHLRKDIINQLTTLSNNANPIVISGALYDYIFYFLNIVGLKTDYIYSSRLIYDDKNRSKGKVDFNYIGKNKLLPLKNYLNYYIISFGDSRNDIPLFNASNEVHVVYPNKKFKSQIINKGWIIHD